MILETFMAFILSIKPLAHLDLFLGFLGALGALGGSKAFFGKAS